MPTSVALSPHFEGFVREQIVSGRFNNVSEVVRAGLRLLEVQQQQRAIELEALRADMQAGLDSGEPRSAHAVFERLEARYDIHVPDAER